MCIFKCWRTRKRAWTTAHIPTKSIINWDNVRYSKWIYSIFKHFIFSAVFWWFEQKSSNQSVGVLMLVCTASKLNLPILSKGEMQCNATNDMKEKLNINCVPCEELKKSMYCSYYCIRYLSNLNNAATVFNRHGSNRFRNFYIDLKISWRDYWYSAIILCIIPCYYLVDKADFKNMQSIPPAIRFSNNRHGTISPQRTIRMKNDRYDMHCSNKCICAF